MYLKLNFNGIESIFALKIEMFTLERPRIQATWLILCIVRTFNLLYFTALWQIAQIGSSWIFTVLKK